MSQFVTPSLLPPLLQQDLSLRALETLASRWETLPVIKTVVVDYDHVDVSALPHLAEQRNVLGDAGWNMADTEAKKRALLKEAIALHRIKGTPYAIRRSLALLGVNATLTEWWQTTPQGTPYTFTIDATVTDQPIGSPALDEVRTSQIQRVVTFWNAASRPFALRVGVGMSTALRSASVFGGMQLLTTAGSLIPVSITGRTETANLAIFSGKSLLVSSGSIQ
jgi:phage tail P2-like protein